MPGVPWIKLWTGIFDDEKIKIIQGLPEGDSIIICWIRLLCMAGKCGATGVVAVDHNIPYTEDMLVSVWGKPKAIIQLALQTLEKLGMIMLLEDNTIKIKNWDIYQKLTPFDEIREYWREQKKKERDQKLITENVRDNSEKCPKCLTQEVELEVELEVEKDILSGKPDPVPYKEIVDYFNKKCKTQFRHTSQQTRALIKARWREGFRLDDFKKAIAWAEFKWAKDAKMMDYLRPQTVFNGKMESYIQNFAREVK